MNRRFSHWARWAERYELEDIEFPGIYAIAISGRSLHGKPFRWTQQIAYFGMTNSVGGLRSRLYQFDRTIAGGKGHSGAFRFRFKHPDYDALVSRLFVAVIPFHCYPRRKSVRDLVVMGEVAKHEYRCIARYRKRYGRLPEFNDMALSPKK